MWTASRELRPQPRPQRPVLDPDVHDCPFCTFEEPDPRLLPFHAVIDGERWSAMHNLFPPVDGPTGTADLAYAVAHGPTLTHLHPRLRDQWAAMLTVQQQLAGRRTDRWSMVSSATGRSAGASQHHPHGHVVTPELVPPATIDRQQRWSDPVVARTLLEDATTVATREDVRLVVPPVPLGPLDLWLLPEVSQRFLDAAPDVLGELIATWVAGVHRQLGDGAGEGQGGGGRDVDPRVAPFDAKVVVHPELPDGGGRPPDGGGRWWAELTVTDRHAPGVAAVPLIDLRHLPTTQAANFRR